MLFVEFCLVCLLLFLIYNLHFTNTESFVLDASEYRKKVISDSSKKYNELHGQLTNIDTNIDTYKNDMNAVINNYNKMKCDKVPYYKIDNEDLSKIYFENNSLHVIPSIEYGIPTTSSAHDIHDIVIDTKLHCKPVDSDGFREELDCNKTKQRCKGEFLNDLIQYGGQQSTKVIDGVNVDVCSYDLCKQFCFDNYACWVNNRENAELIDKTDVDICVPTTETIDCVSNPKSLCPIKTYFVDENGEAKEYNYKISVSDIGDSKQCDYTVKSKHRSDKTFTTLDEYNEYTTCIQTKQSDDVYCYEKNDVDKYMYTGILSFNEDECSYSNSTNKTCLVKEPFTHRFCPMDNYDFFEQTCASNIDILDCKKSVYDIQESWTPISSDQQDDYTRIYNELRLTGNQEKVEDGIECIYPEHEYDLENQPTECKQTCWVIDQTGISSQEKTGELIQIPYGFKCAINNCKTYSYITNEFQQLTDYNDMLQKYQEQ